MPSTSLILNLEKVGSWWGEEEESAHPRGGPMVDNGAAVIYGWVIFQLP